MPQSENAKRSSAAGRRHGARPAAFPRPAAHGQTRTALARQLALRLRQSPDAPDLPLLVINHVPQTKTVHVLVIWDRWKDLPVPDRARAILGAFAEARPDQAGLVTLPIGLTPGEALRQGFLSYRIAPQVRPEDHVSDAEVAEAMAAAGGVLMRVGDDFELRFATRGQANEAYRRLLERINKPIWTMSEESPSPESSDWP